METRAELKKSKNKGVANWPVEGIVGSYSEVESALYRALLYNFSYLFIIYCFIVLLSI